jgi:hypothetical protein
MNNHCLICGKELRSNTDHSRLFMRGKIGTWVGDAFFVKRLNEDAYDQINALCRQCHEEGTGMKTPHTPKENAGIEIPMKGEDAPRRLPGGFDRHPSDEQMEYFKRGGR